MILPHPLSSYYVKKLASSRHPTEYHTGPLYGWHPVNQTGWACWRSWQPMLEPDNLANSVALGCQWWETRHFWNVPVGKLQHRHLDSSQTRPCICSRKWCPFGETAHGGRLILLISNIVVIKLTNNFSVYSHFNKVQFSERSNLSETSLKWHC